MLCGLSSAHRLENLARVRNLGALRAGGRKPEQSEEKRDQSRPDSCLYMQRCPHKVAKLSHPALDEKLLLLINREWISPALDRLMATAASWDAWLPVFFLIGLLMLIRGGFRMRAFVVTALLVVAVNDGIIARTLKRLVDRPRPHQSHNDVRIVDLAKARPRLLAIGQPASVKLSRVSLEEVEGRSFPSAHTLNFFSLALVAVFFFGWRASWVFAIAFLVAYGRIYTGAHWPSDVLTSIFLACGSTLFLLAFAEWAWVRAGLRFFPALHARHPSLVA